MSYFSICCSYHTACHTADASYMSVEGRKMEALVDITPSLELTHISGEPVGCAITIHTFIITQYLLSVCCRPGTVMVLRIHW